MKRPIFTFVALVTLAAPAAAQSRKSGDRVHDFHTLDGLTPMTTFDLGFGFESWDDPKTLGVSTEPVSTILTLDVAAHFVSSSGLGAYLHLPLTFVDTRDIGVPPLVVNGKSKVAIGNFELGGMFSARLGDKADMVFHAGVALPSATDDSDLGEAGGPLGALPRFSDLVDRLPDTTWVRVGASPMGRVGPMFWQFDIGGDFRIAHDDDGSDLSPVVHVNAGVGVDLGQADVTGEFATTIDHPPSGSNADDVGSTLALGARFKSQNVQPGVAIVIPVGMDDVKDFQLGVLVSLAARIP